MIWPMRPTRCSWIATRSTSRLSAVRTGCSVSRGCGALRLERSPSTSREGSVWLHWMKLTPLLGMESDAALAALLDPPQDLLLHQHVVGEVVLAGLQHRAGRPHRVAAALDLELVEERPVRHVVALVDLRADEVARPELGEPVGAGADRGEHADRLARARALRPLEDVAREQPAAGERGGPGGLRLLEDELHGVRVDLLDPRDVLVAPRGCPPRWRDRSRTPS